MAISFALTPSFKSLLILSAIFLASSFSSLELSTKTSSPLPRVGISFLPKRERLCSIKAFATLRIGVRER